MEKKELIKNYLLDENVSEKVRKERFKIAWDIWENFDDITFELRQNFIKAFIRKIKGSEEFKDYEVADLGLLEGEREKPICISKQNWLISKNKKYGVIHYALEGYNQSIYSLYYGIMKYDVDVPFKGIWMNEDVQKEINPDLLNILSKVYKKLNGENEGWKADDEWYIVWRNLDSFNKIQKDLSFYQKLIGKNGLENAVDDLFQEFVELKNATEELIDEFVEIYKQKEK